MRRALVILAATVAGLALAGCEEGGGRAPCPAGKLCLERGNGAEVLTLDPAKASLINEDHVLGDMFTGLTQYDAQSKPVPGIATSWETSPDGLTWTFHLRHSKWSDGVDLTADDFVFTLRRIMDPKTAAEYASILYVLKNGEAVNNGKLAPEALGVDAPDRYTLRLHLEHPTPYLPYITTHQSMYPTPRHAIEKWGDAWAQPEHWVSNGPYKVASWVLGDRIHAVKNPNFFDAGSVCVDEVNYYPTNDAISAERRVKRGELDLNDDIQSNRIAFLRRPDQMPAYVKTNTWLGTSYVVFNRKTQPAFGDLRVRQALAMAIDRDFITGKLLRGGQVPAYSFVPPGVANYPGGAQPHWAGWSFEKRQSEAKRLLAEAGYGPGHPLKLEIKQRNTSDPMLIYPAIQADWKSVGVEATLAPEESQIAYADYRSRNFQAADAAWIADYNDPMTFLYLMRSNAGSFNDSDYRNPAYDALLDKADHENDLARRGQELAQAEGMAMEDATIAPVFHYVSKNLVSPKVTGWVPNIADWHRTRYICFADRKQP
ncbi:MAG: peptide ABC transporter substrate-binding protein [Caulobacteraceae bacterium]